MRNILFASALALATPLCAQAVTVGGLDFDDNAFADSLASASDGFSPYFGVATSLEEALVGTNLIDYTFVTSSSSEESNFVISFDDNHIVNGPGADFVIFDLGPIDIHLFANDPARYDRWREFISVAVSPGGPRRSYQVEDSGENAGRYSVLIAQIDLDDFGLASGDTVSLLQIFPKNSAGADSADITAIGALNSVTVATVPLPAGLPLLSAGLLTLGAFRRRTLAASV